MNRSGAKIILLVVLLLWPVLVACADPPDSSPLPTLIPTAVTAAILDTVTPTGADTGTATRISPTSRPSSTPEPSPTPCVFPVQQDLAPAWRPDELGCPINQGFSTVDTAYAPFEGGQMLWRGDTDMIYVLYNDGRWASFPNEWHEGDPEFTCGEDEPLLTPIRGFGRVWCDHPDVRETLGAVTAGEIGDAGSAVQDFVNGTILVAPFGGVFVLVGEDGRWYRLEPIE